VVDLNQTVRHFFLDATLKEFLKLVYICQSYHKNKSGTFFYGSQCSLSLHCFNQSLYCFWGKKWVALKRAGCWVAVKEPVIVIDLDLHYKHEAVSEKISKSYNFGCIVTAGISFIK